MVTDKPCQCGYWYTCGSVVTDRQWDVVTDKLCVEIVTGLQCGYWYKICQCGYW